MLEKNIETKVCAYAKSLGWIALKFTSPSSRGVPDRIFLREGQTVFIEFKTEKGKPSKLQLIWQAKLVEQGFFCVFIDSVVKGKDFFDDLEYQHVK